ncbi:hypothetical protein N5W20_03540 [Candidatus Kirkpatrickella diaphorinae]|uniref:Uncharacterized protein n=1 Tax=Candidatus Kirkpatrickella diaphorinae TaxID=2984322 RepID=A0ABY6GKU5_9PROT|nr:hypothetical protein [Candidatus Kirkpatrickella diaphorinae]UYH51942.1 hypothetical protein N5W20_03540 [Candidatus Kirkpatrickella diaphorinae]
MADAMEWNEPYLESCCRCALHRLKLAGPAGRPLILRDAPCLKRLCAEGLASIDQDGRVRMTAQGAARHEVEISGMRRRRGVQNRRRSAG